jgi:hypothetical protein
MPAGMVLNHPKVRQLPVRLAQLPKEQLKLNEDLVLLVDSLPVERESQQPIKPIGLGIPTCLTFGTSKSPSQIGSSVR